MLTTINPEVLGTAHDYMEHVDDIFGKLSLADGKIDSETIRHALVLRVTYFRGMMAGLPDSLDAVQEMERLDALLDYVQNCELGKTILEQSESIPPIGWDMVETSVE